MAEKSIALFLFLAILSFFLSVPRCWLRRGKGSRYFFPVRKFFIRAFVSNPDCIFWICLAVAFLAIWACFLNYTLDVTALCLILVYCCLPGLVLYNRGQRKIEPAWKEFAVMLWLWLPLEAAMSAGWLRFYFGPVLGHIMPWGGATVLALFLFLSYRNMPGMKCCFPYRREDFAFPLVGFLAAGLILIPLGRALSFMGSFGYAADPTLEQAAKIFAGIFFGVALVEEILFRSLIQNWLMLKFGATNAVLLFSSLIFGMSHINNFSKLQDGTIAGAPPNWKYVLLATVAGFIYGKVFQKTNSVVSSAALHAAVNTVRHLFFG